MHSPRFPNRLVTGYHESIIDIIATTTPSSPPPPPPHRHLCLQMELARTALMELDRTLSALKLSLADAEHAVQEFRDDVVRLEAHSTASTPCVCLWVSTVGRVGIVI